MALWTGRATVHKKLKIEASKAIKIIKLWMEKLDFHLLDQKSNGNMYLVIEF